MFMFFVKIVSVVTGLARQSMLNPSTGLHSCY